MNGPLSASERGSRVTEVFTDGRPHNICASFVRSFDHSSVGLGSPCWYRICAEKLRYSSNGDIVLQANSSPTQDAACGIPSNEKFMGPGITEILFICSRSIELLTWVSLDIWSDDIVWKFENVFGNIAHRCQ